MNMRESGSGLRSPDNKHKENPRDTELAKALAATGRIIADKERFVGSLQAQERQAIEAHAQKAAEFEEAVKQGKQELAKLERWSGTEFVNKERMSGQKESLRQQIEEMTKAAAAHRDAISRMFDEDFDQEREEHEASQDDEQLQAS